MNLSNIDNFYSSGEGARSSEIIKVADQFGFELPEDYVLLLKEANGFMLENGVLVYSTDDVFERNDTFEVQEYAPGYIAIGDDSGGRCITLDIKTRNVFIVDQSTMEPDDMEKVADTIGIWVKDNCCLPSE